MDVIATPAPLAPTPNQSTPVPLEVVTKVLTEEAGPDDGAFAALIGGVVGAALLALVCAVAMLLWFLSRRKGSYVTNEMDGGDDDDDESDGSDMALQGREPLTED